MGETSAQTEKEERDRDRRQREEIKKSAPPYSVSNLCLRRTRGITTDVLIVYAFAFTAEEFPLRLRA
jgi:hypothetical protein